MRRAAAAAIDRYILPAGPTAANPPQQHAAVDRWDRQMAGHRTVTQAAYYTSSVNSQLYRT